MKAQKRNRGNPNGRGFGVQKSHGVGFFSGRSVSTGMTRRGTERKHELLRGEEGPICGGSLAYLEQLLAKV